MSRHCHHGPLSGYPHTHTIILLHGRGSSGAEFATEFFESEASASPGTPQARKDLLHLFPTVRWVFPSAPERISERFSELMPQWFDMWATERPQERPELQTEALRQSVGFILDVIREEEKEVARKNIILGGISQGFATAVGTFFTDGRGFGGLLGVCTWMPPQYEGDEAIPQGPRPGDGDSVSMMATPVFLAHAADDSVVPIEHGEHLRDFLRQRGLAMEWHQYGDGGHWFNEPQGVDDIAAFLDKLMVNTVPAADHTTHS